MLAVLLVTWTLLTRGCGTFRTSCFDWGMADLIASCMNMSWKAKLPKCLFQSSAHLWARPWGFIWLRDWTKAQIINSHVRFQTVGPTLPIFILGRRTSHTSWSSDTWKLKNYLQGFVHRELLCFTESRSQS